MALNDKKKLQYITGILGVLAAVLVGAGEYLLHYDPLARFSEGGYDFMQGAPQNRVTFGHFLGVFGAVLYPVGCYHLYLMLKSGSEKIAIVIAGLGAISFFVGAVWIGSRASISALMQYSGSDVSALIALYELRYETLLQVVRLGMLLISILFIVTVLQGKTLYRRWMAFFNPITLIIVAFLIYFMIPSLGVHLMPIALNFAFFVLFLLSIYHVYSPNREC